MTDNKGIWSAASAPALLLGGISIIYLGWNHLMISVPWFQNSFGGTLAGLAMWLIKFICCLSVMKMLMKRFSSANPELDNATVFRFGAAVAVLSALLYSAAYLGYATFIAPDILSRSFDSVVSAYSANLNSNTLSSLEDVEGSLPSLYFFTNLIYCSLFGIVLSAIYSRNIPPRNPFDREEEDDDQ